MPETDTSANSGIDTSDQSQKDKKTVAMAEKLYARYKQHRANFDGEWIENYKFFRGKQWTEARPNYKNSDVYNLMWSSIQTLIPILTDSRPNIETVPENPSDFEFSEIMTQVLRSNWDRDNFTQVLVEAIIDSAIYGTAITDQSWDQELNNGIGNYVFATVDPLHVYPCPRTRDINDKFGKGLITAVPTDLAEVKRRHPKKAHMVKADLGDEDNAQQSKLQRDDFKVRTPTDNFNIVTGDKASEGSTTPQVLLKTAWLDDDTMIEEKVMEKDENGKDKQKGFQTKKKYPFGRKIVWASNILLEDDENPYIEGPSKPFAKLVDYIMPREFWGEGEISQLKGPQQAVNKMLAHVMDTLSLMGNPVWKNPVGSGVFSDSIMNKPGLIIDYNDGAEPHREMGVDVQSSVFSALDRIQSIFDKISGQNDISQGRVPSGISGVAVEELQEAAQTRARLKGRNIEAWLNNVGQQHASRILQFYSVPRIVRITENENTEKYFKFVVDEHTNEKGEIQRTATVQDFEQVQQEDGSQQMTEQPPRQFEIKGNLDVRISVGTTLPLRKAQKKAQAKELFQMGIYDAEDLLRDLEHPRSENILQKYNKRQQAAAEAQAQAEQQEQQFRMAELQVKAGAGQQQQPQQVPSQQRPLGSV